MSESVTAEDRISSSLVAGMASPETRLFGQDETIGAERPVRQPAQADDVRTAVAEATRDGTEAVRRTAAEGSDGATESPK